MFLSDCLVLVLLAALPDWSGPSRDAKPDSHLAAPAGDRHLTRRRDTAALSTDPKVVAGGRESDNHLVTGEDQTLVSGPVRSFSVDADSSGALWLVASDTGVTAHVYRSTDLGASWARLFSFSQGCPVPKVEVVVGHGRNPAAYVFYLASANSGDLYVLRIAVGARLPDFAGPVAAGADTIDDFSVAVDNDSRYYLYCLYANERRPGRTGSFTRSTDFGESWDFPLDFWNCWDPAVTASSGSAVLCAWRYAADGRQIHISQNTHYGRLGHWSGSVNVSGWDDVCFDPVIARADTGPDWRSPVWIVFSRMHIDSVVPDTGLTDSSQSDTMPPDTVPPDTSLDLGYAWSWDGYWWATGLTLGYPELDEWFPDVKSVRFGRHGRVHLCYNTGSARDHGKTAIYWRSASMADPGVWTRPVKINDRRANARLVDAGPRIACPPGTRRGEPLVFFSHYHADHGDGIHFGTPWQGGLNDGRATGAVRVRAEPNPCYTGVRLAAGAGTAGPVRLAVYDLTGRLVRRLDTESPVHGTEVEWDLRDSSGNKVNPGLYVVRLSGPGCSSCLPLTIAP